MFGPVILLICGVLSRWYYLATIIDVYTRKIVGWSISIHHDTKLILEALYDVLSKQQTPSYLHFDRGSEYLSGQHLDLLDSLEIHRVLALKVPLGKMVFKKDFMVALKQN